MKTGLPIQWSRLQLSRQQRSRLQQFQLQRTRLGLRMLVLVTALSFGPSSTFGTSSADPTDTRPQPEVISTEAAKVKIREFDRFFAIKGKTLPAIEEFEKKKEIQRLARYDHRLIVKQLTKLLRDKNYAYRIEAATGLRRLKSDPDEATRGLSRVLDPSESNGAFLAAVIRALGTFKHRPSLDKIIRCLDHKSDAVFMASVWAQGEIGSLKAIKFLQVAFETNFLPPGKGVNVRVDTGAAGNADRAAAAAKGKSRQKKRRPNRDKVLEELRLALKKLTGEDFEKPEELKPWIEANKKRIKADSRR